MYGYRRKIIMEEQDRECREIAKAIFQEFLSDHLKDKVIDNWTYEILLESLDDYV